MSHIHIIPRTPKTTPDNLNLVRPKELCEILGISIPTLYRWEANGDLPIDKIKFGKRAVGYRISDVEKWLNGELEEKTA